MSTASSVPGFTQRRLALVIGALVLAVFMSSIETSIIATALPTIIGQFNSFESYAWVGTAYIVTSTISTPLLGKLSDLYGRRVIFQTTMGVFVLGSLLCGLSQSMGQLIAARAVQGVGGGAIQALAFAVIADIIPPRDRGRFIGWFTLAFAGSALLGPLVGGFIVDQFSWPWIFYMNIPFALGVAAVCHRALKLPFNRREAKLDYLGAATLSAAIACLMIGLEQGQKGWTHRGVLLLFACSAVALAAFVGVERRAPEPLIPLRLFANPVVLSCMLLGMCAGVYTYGGGPFLPLYFQDSLFISPTQSGLRVLPQMVGVTFATFGVGRVIAKIGRYKPFPIVGSAVAVVGLLAMSMTLTRTSQYLWMVIPMVLMGFGGASVFTTTSIASQNAVDFRDLGVTTATVMFFRSLGGSFGLAGLGTLLNSTIRSEIPARIGVKAEAASSLIRAPKQIAGLPTDQRDAVVHSLALGVSRIYLACSLVMVASFIVAVLLPERPLRHRAGLSDAMEQAAAH